MNPTDQLVATPAPASLAAWERCRRSVGGGVSSGQRATAAPHPLFVDRAAGALVWDLDGREHVDYVGAWGPMVLGHSHPVVLEAVAAVLPRLQMPGMGHRGEYEAAEAVLAAVPGAERLLWSNSGTEAVQVALRLARAFTGRNKVVKFVGAYHGWHDSVYASVTRHEPGERATAQTRGQNPHALEDLVVLPFNDVERVRAVLAEAAERDIAAVIVDPVLSSGGLVAPDPEFLRALREGCDGRGTLLVLDEVITGFRVARGGAAERWGVTPDLWTCGKAIAGGFAHSAVLGRADVIDQVSDGVTHSGTYNGNPVALAAVEATMRVLAEPGTYERLEETSEQVLAGIRRAAAATGADLRPYRVGSILSLGLTDRPALARLQSLLLEEGVLLLPTGKMFVSTAHDRAAVQRTETAFARALGRW
ncbi:aspartate aminotransferase family protein [Kineococcus sp. SYSU DK001]|uniref:aspartate aminotransferase family protein n=1 Tax=Kineococcus sp. SYSU DK001 TaxID=3383122 RepID=UPI003D7E94C0